MKILLPVVTVMLVLFSCNNSPKEVTVQKKEVPKKQNFFPVTSYIQGQLYEYRKIGINPLRYTTINGRMDSSWLKVEELDEAVKDFLHPEIDSSNLISLFTEKNFLDQTLDAYTFTYDPIDQLPDTMTLRHWDVYIDSKTGKVKRVYMVKEISNNKTLQLTWQSDKWCKITTLATDQNGTSTVEKEEKITWDFNNK